MLIGILGLLLVAELVRIIPPKLTDEDIYGSCCREEFYLMEDRPYESDQYDAYDHSFQDAEF